MILQVIQPGTWPPRKSSMYIHEVTPTLEGQQEVLGWSGRGAGQGVGDPGGREQLGQLAQYMSSLNNSRAR